MAFQAPKTLHFKGQMANFEATNTVKPGKNAKRTNGTDFTRVRGPTLSQDLTHGGSDFLDDGGGKVMSISETLSGQWAERRT